MNIPIETLVGWGATGILIIGHAFVSNYKITQNSSEIKDLWNWKNTHEKDVSEKRLELQKQFGAIEGRLITHDGNYQTIIQMLGSLSDKIDKLEEKFERRNQ